MYKRIIVLFLALPLVFACVSCAPSGSKNEVLRDDVPLSELSAAIETHLNPDSLIEVNDNYLKGMKLDTSLFAEYTVKINAFGANIDEYGIFKAKNSAELKSVQTAVNGYLKLKLDSWMDGYMPEEKPKLENAEVKTEGLYVMYAILSDSEKETVFKVFSDGLTITAETKNLFS